MRDQVPDPRADYARRKAENKAARDSARRSSVRIGTWRLLTFLALVAALVGARVSEGRTELVAMAAAIVLAGAFIGEIHWHWRTREREAWHEGEQPAGDEGRLVGTGDPASRELRRLGRLLDTVQDRRNIFYAILSFVLLLDLRCLLVIQIVP